MKKLFLLLAIFISVLTYGQNVKITGTSFTIHHRDLTFYLDADTNTFVSVHTVTAADLQNLTGTRKDRWHVEAPKGPYKKTYYVNTGYDLGHLTPCKITMYDDSTNYFTFSMFNQAPQLSYFNEHPWEQLEMSVIKTIQAANKNAVVITGVIYDNKNKTYLATSRIKIPIDYYKILALSDGTVTAWIGSNINGLVTVTDVKSILEIAAKNGDSLGIQITK